jgi:hypothetical protein
MDIVATYQVCIFFLCFDLQILKNSQPVYCIICKALHFVNCARHEEKCVIAVQYKEEVP